MLLCGLSLYAQDMKTLFIAMPDSVAPLLTKVNREDCVDFLASNMKAEVKNRFGKVSELKRLTDDYLFLQTTGSSSMEMKLLPLNDSVKALSIDGVEASADNIKNGTYAVARPFNIATDKEVSEVTKDFISFILSEDGQAVVEENGYISQGNTGAFKSTEAEGKIVVAGSSSVTPVMEKLKEAYLAINPNATIEVQQSDSTTGMTSAMEGMCDIGMASRELKDSELAAGLTPTVIAMDGIAVVVNHNNTVDNLTSEQVKEIFTGKLTDWSAAQ